MTAIDFRLALLECLDEFNAAPAQDVAPSVWRPCAPGLDFGTVDEAASDLPNLAVVGDFVSDAEEAWLRDMIYDGNEREWHHLVKRRLQNWGGFPHYKGMYQEQLPGWAGHVCRRLEQSGYWNGGPAVNQILLNEYTGGRGIAAHKDGPNYDPPAAAVLSLLSDARMVFRSPDGIEKRVNLPRKSLLVFSGEYFTDWTHCVPDCEARGPVRLSMTMRQAKVDANLSGLTPEGKAEINDRKQKWIRAVTEAR
ncbi:hypothetical protein DIPPA_04415 [Diplonema papillatum]|nr:hypothetical protein DIPPA_04415 [Diplonema papillatum]